MVYGEDVNKLCKPESSGKSIPSYIEWVDFFVECVELEYHRWIVCQIKDNKTIFSSLSSSDISLSFDFTS